jgi:hypothetical protein
MEPLLSHPHQLPPPPIPDEKSFKTMILVLIFLESIGLYGFVVSMFVVFGKQQ